MQKLSARQPFSSACGRIPERRMPAYIGRFAPSPSGPLHLGSLVTALASFLDARSQGGRWLVRMEDLDRARTVPGAADAILRTLEAFGLHWDGAVLYQHQRMAHYREALEQLRRQDQVFPCACTRKHLEQARMGPEGPLYPGTCRRGLPQGKTARTVRFRVPDRILHFQDRFQGTFVQSLSQEVGDFVIWRADGVPAYQLAVVVDDGWQGVTQVIRGADLLVSTPRQQWLQRCLDLPSPTYGHVPLVRDASGRKLSKSDRSPPVDPRDPLPSLLRAWRCLRQLPLEVPPADLSEFWAQALTQWQPELLGALVPPAEIAYTGFSPQAGVAQSVEQLIRNQ